MKTKFLYIIAFVGIASVAKIHSMQEKEDVEDCSICLEAIDTDSPESCVKTRCNHNFHSKCIHRWVYECEKNSCPLCRAELYLERRNVRGVSCSRVCKPIMICAGVLTFLLVAIWPVTMSLLDDANKLF